MTDHGGSSRSQTPTEAAALPTDVTTDYQTDSARGGVKTVAIIGAGFAGLVLANYLELYRKNCQNLQQNKDGKGIHPENLPWTYKLYESKSSSGIPVIGTISLESAREVLEELRLFEEACSEESRMAPVFPQRTRSRKFSTTSQKNDDQYNEVSRESFLELLRQNVKIQSSSKVVDVIVGESFTSGSSEKINHSNYFVLIEGDNGERVQEGPFDQIVAANGLSFRGETTKAMQRKLKSSSSIIKIGDSRYRYDRSWWQFDFLGITRRTSGANTAILDGLAAGRSLLQQREEGSNPRCSDDASLVEKPFVSLRNYATRISNENEKVRNLVWIIVAILVPIFLAIFAFTPDARKYSYQY